ncbi:MAG: VWA domain-containing protein [Polyangiaceae bacterium]
MTSAIRKGFWVFPLLGAAFAACSSDASAPPGSGVAASGGTGGGGGSGGSIIVDAGGSGGLDPDASCGAVSESAKNSPLHLYIMLDKSSSMAGNQWTSAVAGLNAFLASADSAGVSVGLKFFPREADATPVCDQKAYSKPDVAFGVLPGNASALAAALGAATPNGLSTPTYPALGGGILKAIELAQNNPGDAAAVLLVTDGVPQGPASVCGTVNPEDWNEIASLAAAGANFNPPVTTYVVGLPGVDQSFANQIAKAGGSSAAILVSNTNVQAEFEKALAKVRGQALPCEYEIPDKVSKGEIAYDFVNVVLQSGGKSTNVLQTSDCNLGAGWYYDDPTDPSKILLCPSVCANLKQDFTASLQILMGCKTQVVR